MWQIHTDTNFERAQKVLSVLPPLLTQSHILSDVFSVVPPEFKSHGGQRNRLAQGTYEERPTRERESGRKGGGRAPKTTGKKHGPKEARPLSFWLVEKYWECNFLNPSLSGRETGGRRTGNPEAATKRTCSLGEEARERECWSGSKDNDLITVCHHEWRAWPLLSHTHTVKLKTVFTPTQGHDRVDEFQLKHLTLYERAEYGCLFYKK